MKISPEGIAFIEGNESFRATPYQDAGGKWAWGYGHDQLLGEPVPVSVTEQEAEAQLLNDLSMIEVVLCGLIPAGCTQNQYDALCDFAYNDGVGALRKMLAHGWDQVPVQMLRWDHVGAAINAGLLTRREKEVVLFKS